MGLRSVVLMKFMILLHVMLAVKATAAKVDQAKPGCPSQCGEVSIPYPFGTGGHCNISEDFFVTCNTTFTPNKPFLTTGNIEIVNISLDGRLRIVAEAGYDCYNASGRADNWERWLQLSRFSINNSRNKFTAIGCDTYARVRGYVGKRYATGCLSLCNNITDVTNGSCSSIGCCQTSIPTAVRSYSISLQSYNNHSDVLPENPCSYAFVAEEDAYTFFSSDIRGYDFKDKKFPVTLDWTIGKNSCKEEKTDTKNFARKKNSNCVDSENSSGYFCKCFEGFEGNPHLPGGCQDINECDTLRPCNWTCLNLAGGFSCSCPEGYEGDGLKNGTGCSLPNKPHNKRSPLIDVALDDQYTAKVSDFGVSRLIPSEQAQISTIVQGTFGYLDPEYMLSSFLTEKSGVYSFGVVLTELLTGQKVVSFERSEEKRVLAMYFVSLMKEDRLLEILDTRMMNGGNVEQLKEVAALARRCVRVKGEERPSMKVVAYELAGLQAMARHPRSESNLEEAESVLGDMFSTYGDGETSSWMGCDSITKKVTFDLEGAR